MITLSRRALLASSAGALLAACAPAGHNEQASAASTLAFSDSPWRSLSPDQWRERLTPQAFRVLREQGTERAFTSPLNEEHRAGVFHCAGCDLPLFRSEWKFESGTGWPSFSDAMQDHIGTSVDFLIGTPRTEYHCARCLGHQGHVFPDGPAPTGLRYCNNGVALRFQPA